MAMKKSLAEKNWTNIEAGMPLVQVENVSRIIESRVQRTVILDSLNFTVPEQSLFAINGPSGSGKSTILNILTGIDRPSSGHVVFAGEELRAKSENGLAKWRGHHVGIVFQFFQLIPTLTAVENVLLALELGGGGDLPRREWRQQALHCLDMVGIKELANRQPSSTRLSTFSTATITCCRLMGFSLRVQFKARTSLSTTPVYYQRRATRVTPVTAMGSRNHSPPRSRSLH